MNYVIHGHNTKARPSEKTKNVTALIETCRFPKPWSWHTSGQQSYWHIAPWSIRGWEWSIQRHCLATFSEQTRPKISPSWGSGLDFSFCRLTGLQWIGRESIGVPIQPPDGPVECARQELVKRRKSLKPIHLWTRKEKVNKKNKLSLILPPTSFQVTPRSSNCRFFLAKTIWNFGSECFLLPSPGKGREILLKIREFFHHKLTLWVECVFRTYGTSFAKSASSLQRQRSGFLEHFKKFSQSFPALLSESYFSKTFFISSDSIFDSL